MDTESPKIVRLETQLSKVSTDLDLDKLRSPSLSKLNSLKRKSSPL